MTGPPKTDEERRDAELRIHLFEGERQILDDAADGETSNVGRGVLLAAALRKMSKSGGRGNSIRVAANSPAGYKAAAPTRTRTILPSDRRLVRRTYGQTAVS